MHKTLANIRQRAEKGAMLVTAALGVTALMFGTAIAVDLGSFYARSSELQNAADSAALAGASVYLEGGDTKIIPLSRATFGSGDSSLSFSIDGTNYDFKSYGTTSKADAKAANYVDSNDSAVTFSDNATTTAWTAAVTATMANGKTASYSNAYCYRVVLHQDLPMHFAKFFGIDTYPINVTALALVMPGETTDPSKNIDEFIKVVNANIFKTIPNLYWETIHDGSQQYYINNAGQKTYYKGYGDRNGSYFTTSYQSYVVDITKSKTLAGNYLAYKNSDKNKFCATGITGYRSTNLYQLEYTLNSDLIRKKATGGVEITGLFLDRPNVGSNSTIRGTVLNITGESLSDYNDVPLFMRFESEPIRVGSSLTYVQPITINVDAYQEKPLVIAYDGPDPNRTASDAPKVDTKTGAYGGNTSTATTQSAPYTINLNNADFNGVIYAPYSKVTITGTGKITGFIMAAEIDDQTTNSSSRTTLKSHSVELPTWGATPRDSSNNRFDYTVKNISNTYTVVYDDFHNYTMPTTTTT